MKRLGAGKHEGATLRRIHNRRAAGNMEQQRLVLLEAGKLQWMRKPLPELSKDEVLVKTMAGSISIGAEIAQYRGHHAVDSQSSYPKETGYESYGEVIAVGEAVRSLNVGDRVVAFYGHKDYEKMKEHKAIRVPPGIEAADALLVILSCDAAKGVLKLQPEENDRVLITGMGTMGLLTLHFLKAYQNVRHVDVLEPNRSRGRMAARLGASNVFHDPEECLADRYDYGFECSAYNRAFATLQRALVKEGHICILSDGNRDEFVLQPAFYEKELRIVGSSDGWDYQKHAEWYFANFKLHDSTLRDLYEMKISSQQLIPCFEALGNGTQHPLKVLVEY